MEINPWGVLVVVGLSFIAAFLISLIILSFLTSLKILRVKSLLGLFAWSMVGGVLITIIFWTAKCNCYADRTSDGIHVVPDTLQAK